MQDKVRSVSLPNYTPEAYAYEFACPFKIRRARRAASAVRRLIIAPPSGGRERMSAVSTGVGRVPLTGRAEPTLRES